MCTYVGGRGDPHRNTEGANPGSAYANVSVEWPDYPPPPPPPEKRKRQPLVTPSRAPPSPEGETMAVSPPLPPVSLLPFARQSTAIHPAVTRDSPPISILPDVTSKAHDIPRDHTPSCFSDGLRVVSHVPPSFFSLAPGAANGLYSGLHPTCGPWATNGSPTPFHHPCGPWATNGFPDPFHHPVAREAPTITSVQFPLPRQSLVPQASVSPSLGLDLSFQVLQHSPPAEQRRSPRASPPQSPLLHLPAWPRQPLYFPCECRCHHVMGSCCPCLCACSHCDQGSQTDLARHKCGIGTRPYIPPVKSDYQSWSYHNFLSVVLCHYGTWIVPRLHIVIYYVYGLFKQV